MKAGFIGYGSFAKKINILFSYTNLVDEFLFFHPQKTIEGLFCTTKLEDLFECDFIVIVSPDWTHGQYLRQLQDYKGYVFCEKIPVISREDLSFLKNQNNPLIYFDFNYRKSYMYSLLQEYQDKILYINHRMGHGLALKEKYKNNWRSNIYYTPLGVFQLSGIHFFDLLVFCFGSPLSYRMAARNISSFGDAIDNFAISLEFENKIFADLFFSYTSAYQFSTDITTTDELIEYNGRELIVKGPRETFDVDGLYTHPPVVLEKKMDLYNDSLNNSISYFLDVVKSGGTFYETFLESNLKSTELFLDILDNLKDNWRDR